VDLERAEGRRVERRLNFGGIAADEVVSDSPQRGTATAGSKAIAILANGVLTNSDDTRLLQIEQCLRAEYDTAYFGYGGARDGHALPYTKAQTLIPIPDTYQLLSEQLAYYATAERIALCGYSIGGIILVNWLQQQRNKSLSRVDRLILIASPIFSRQPAVRVETEEHLQVQRTLGDYQPNEDFLRSAVGEEAIRCVVLRCLFGRDRIFDNDRPRISMLNKGLEVEEIAVPRVDHLTIAPSPVTAHSTQDWLAG
jgi:hypothetical protein